MKLSPYFSAKKHLMDSISTRFFKENEQTSKQKDYLWNPNKFLKALI
jgi:hypothetical protein